VVSASLALRHPLKQLRSDLEYSCGKVKQSIGVIGKGEINTQAI